MTYEEALFTLNSLGETYTKNGEIYHRRVSPKKSEDDNLFTDTLRSRSVSEKEMKSMSSNNEFIVRGFSTKTYPYV